MSENPNQAFFFLSLFFFLMNICLNFPPYVYLSQSMRHISIQASLNNTSSPILEAYPCSQVCHAIRSRSHLLSCHPINYKQGLGFSCA
ncbi:hypothetical protein F4801DRAFT_567286 [Xylaria longipes]|nr:hypothetical protein F4801DRAFT_567286 [Xylaria longipes]